MNENFLPRSGGGAAVPKILKKRNQIISSVSPNLIKHQILNAEEKARTILEKAQATADELVIDAELQSEEIRRTAYQSGRDTAETELAENLLAIREKRSEVFSTVEQDVLKLAVKLAEKIIGREIKQDENTRGEIVFNALRAARQQEMVTVRVNTADLPLVEQMREQRSDAFGRMQYIDFVADQAVKEGGCIIESQSGTIDARLETQLRILENALLARVSDEN